MFTRTLLVGMQISIPTIKKNTEWSFVAQIMETQNQISERVRDIRENKHHSQISPSCLPASSASLLLAFSASVFLYLP